MSIEKIFCFTCGVELSDNCFLIYGEEYSPECHEEKLVKLKSKIMEVVDYGF